MVIDPSARTVTRLGRLVGDGTETVSDADLVRRYVNAHDGTAFAALVRRHGPMVFGVCRRTLTHTQDAEDAFQATFLILARKADTFRPERVGRWLYGVAVRVANKARVRRMRRMAVERQLEHTAEPPAAPESPPRDWLQLLDAALARLSDRDRWPILLCDLLGRSRAEAAAELGIAEGTLSSRLARSRDKLRARLARLGAVLSLPTLAAGLSDEANATVPPSLIQSTAAAGTSVVAARELAEGVLRTMLLAKTMKLAAAGVLLLGAATAGIIWLPTAGSQTTVVGQETPKGTPPAKQAAKPDPDLARIQGTWVVESREPGEPAARRGDDDHLLRVDFSGAWEGQPMTFDSNGVEFLPFPGRTRRFRLDSTREPKWIDFTFRDADANGTRQRSKSQPSIYRFDGDKLRIVLGDDELEARPDSFEMPRKPVPFVYLVLRRPTEVERRRLEQVEQQQLQGTWIGVFRTVRGESQDLSSGVKLVVKGDRLRFDASQDDPLHATFELDISARPWSLDLTVTADGGGAKKGQKVPGIIFRQGFMVNLALGDRDRPASFEEAGKNGTVYTFLREGQTPRPWVDLVRSAPTKRPITPPATPDNTRLRELQQERVKALEEQLRGQFERVKTGRDPLSSVLDAARELSEAELDIATTHEAKLAAVEKMLKLLRDCEEQLIALRDAGLQTKEGVAQARAARLKAEIQLEKLKAEK